MSRAAYDRARAEYIKSHSRERRLRLAWLLTEYVAGRNGEDIDIANTGFCLRVEGVDMGQLNALCDSIKSGLTSPMLQRFALYSSRIFYHLFRYVSKRIDRVLRRILLHAVRPKRAPLRHTPRCLS